MKKVILDLCGGTGAWNRPYKEAGYTVWNVTLPDYDVTDVMFGKFSFCLGNYTRVHPTFVDYKDIWGILAAPPCTMFSLARTRAKKPRDFREGMEVVEACLRLIWEVRKRGELAFWALENPMGYLRQFLGKPPFTFDPCDFGDPYTKKTDLWGYYNEPKKNLIKLNELQKRKSQTNAGKVYGRDELTRQEVRAITPVGFANAFYKANP